MLLVCAAWTVTAPDDSDVEPSGTSSASAAAKAGIPVEFADDDPDDPPTLREDGAPSPLTAAVQGRMPSQHVPEGRSSRERPTPDDPTPDNPTPDDPALDRPDRSGPRPMTPSTPRATTPAATSPGTTASGRPAPRNRFQLVVRQATQFAVAAAATLGVVVALSVLNALRKRLRR